MAAAVGSSGDACVGAIGSHIVASVRCQGAPSGGLCGGFPTVLLCVQLCLQLGVSAQV